MSILRLYKEQFLVLCPHYNFLKDVVLRLNKRACGSEDVKLLVYSKYFRLRRNYNNTRSQEDKMAVWKRMEVNESSESFNGEFEVDVHESGVFKMAKRWLLISRLEFQ